MKKRKNKEESDALEWIISETLAHHSAVLHTCFAFLFPSLRCQQCATGSNLMDVLVLISLLGLYRETCSMYS